MPETPTEQTAPADARAAHRYTAALAGVIEPRWQDWWARRGTFRQPNPGEEGFDATKPKFYCLDMFPYPSGAGLHVGHPEGYTATDIVCRYKRMRGYNVLHPMGWDAFGLPAEQYAIQTGVHPAETTRKSIDNFRRQLQRFGFCYDWSREFGTIDEGYYRWTQWIFLRLYKSWFDADAGRGGMARPMRELEDGFESGEREIRVNPSAAEHDAEAKSKRWTGWGAMPTADKRLVLDSYRLAYIGEQTVNWCPKLGTALANEEVIDGRSERGSFPVYRKPLRQWMLRITAYADRLLADLPAVDWPESTRTQQAEWIGRSEGAEIEFALERAPSGHAGPLRVFTTRPDTLFGATYMVVAPEHPLVGAVLDAGGNPKLAEYVSWARDRSDVERQESKDKTGVDTGVRAVNPANGESIPVWAADYVLMGYGTGAIMAVPGQDQRDWDFAKAFGLGIVRTVEPEPGFDGKAYTGEGPAINSGFLDGLGIAEAKAKMSGWLEAKGHGSRCVTFRLRDWLFSRQRYWGEPFPVVFDADGHHHPVADASLPVKLPPLTDYQPIESDDPAPLLAKATEWLTTTAGEAGAEGIDAAAPITREANTMPGWAGSCWYYLRYADAHNDSRFASRGAERYWMLTPKDGVSRDEADRLGTFDGSKHRVGGVDLYIGGSEHAVLHLLYARFWHKVLFDLGEVSTPEPFDKLFHQGLITSFAYQDQSGRLTPIDEVEERDGMFVLISTGEEVRQITAKMSKTLKNVVNPDDIIAEYGADTFRLYEMYMGPLEATKPWNTKDTIGLFRFCQRAWRMIVDEETGSTRVRDEGTGDQGVEKLLHRITAKVGADIEQLGFNTAIAALIEFVNAAGRLEGVPLTLDQAGRFCRVLGPFAPHLSEELWHRLGLQDAHGSVADAQWPVHDPAMLLDDEVEIPVQVLGKVRSKVVLPAGASDEMIEAAALDDEKIKAQLAGKTVRKVIVVPGRLVNIVAN